MKGFIKGINGNRNVAKTSQCSLPRLCINKTLKGAKTLLISVFKIFDGTRSRKKYEYYHRAADLLIWLVFATKDISLINLIILA